MSDKDSKNINDDMVDDCGCDDSCKENCSCSNDEINSDETSVSGDEALFEGSELLVLKKRNEFLEKEVKNKEDELLRNVADLDNYRKRLIKESDDKIKYSNQSLVADFIPVIDNIELTLCYVKDEDKNLKEGLELTIKVFKDKLAKYGVNEIECTAGTKFNPQFHEALMMDNLEEFEDNVITLCVQKGYTLNDRVIRAAKVKVNKR